MYKCPAGHERDIILNRPPGVTLFGCNHPDHPAYSPTKKPKSEYENQIHEHWKADQRIWQGYRLIRLGGYAELATQIQCPKGHVSTVSPLRIIHYNAGCSHKECMALRIFLRGSTYKHFDYAGKVGCNNTMSMHDHLSSLIFRFQTFKYQGFEDRLLRILLKRFVSDTVDTNAQLMQPVSFMYKFNDAIHHYFPDIKVRTPSFERWYEVKSEYTYDYSGLDDDLRAQNHAKWKAAASKSGLVFDAYIWNHDITKLKIIRYSPNGTFETFNSLYEADMAEQVVVVD